MGIFISCLLMIRIASNFCRHDRAKAVEILVKDLKVFSAFNEDLFKEITQLLTLENFRYEDLALYWFLFFRTIIVVLYTSQW